MNPNELHLNIEKWTPNKSIIPSYKFTKVKDNEQVPISGDSLDPCGINCIIFNPEASDELY